MNTLTDESNMPFGKYKDKTMEEVPASYLLWLGSEMAKKDSMNQKEKAVFAYIEENYDVLQKEAQT